MKLRHFVQKMKKNILKDGLDTKKDAKRDAKFSFCCSVTLNNYYMNNNIHLNVLST